LNLNANRLKNDSHIQIGQSTRERRPVIIFARMARWSRTVAADQPAISSNVRPQPTHRPSSTVHTPVQGDGTMGSIVVDIGG